MLWYTGSSSVGLPFIHDSFRANPRAVHHKPKASRQQQQTQKNADADGKDPVARKKCLNHRDVSREALDPENLKLPAVEASHLAAGPLSSSRVTPRAEAGKEASPATSFSSYMRRYKACARLKGFSPSRAYCSTRTRPTAADSGSSGGGDDLDLHVLHQSHASVHNTHRAHAKDSLPVTAGGALRVNQRRLDSNSKGGLADSHPSPRSSLPPHPHPHPHPHLNGSASEAPAAPDKLDPVPEDDNNNNNDSNNNNNNNNNNGHNSKDNKINSNANRDSNDSSNANNKEADAASGDTNDSKDKANSGDGSNTSRQSGSAIRRQIEEKLRRGSSEDDGMKSNSGGGGYKGQRGARDGQAAGGGGPKASGGRGRSVGCGSGRVGGGGGGGRPLGDIVSPLRLQELLSHQDDRTLPYTYYRTAIGDDGTALENVQMESPN